MNGSKHCGCMLRKFNDEMTVDEIRAMSLCCSVCVCSTIVSRMAVQLVKWRITKLYDDTNIVLLSAQFTISSCIMPQGVHHTVRDHKFCRWFMQTCKLSRQLFIPRMQNEQDGYGSCRVL